MNPYFLFGAMAGRPVLPTPTSEPDSGRWLYLLIERAATLPGFRRQTGKPAPARPGQATRARR